MRGLEFVWMYLIVGEIVALAMTGDRALTAIIQGGQQTRRWVLYLAASIVVVTWPAVLIWLLAGERSDHS
jgi:hypothetical protein